MGRHAPAIAVQRQRLLHGSVNSSEIYSQDRIRRTMADEFDMTPDSSTDQNAQQYPDGAHQNVQRTQTGTETHLVLPERPFIV